MLKGKTAVVTGGTRGIGFAIAKRYLENGANAAIAGSRQETAEKALAQLAEYEGRVMGIWPGVSDPEEVAEAAAEKRLRENRVAVQGVRRSLRGRGASGRLHLPAPAPTHTPFSLVNTGLS